MLNLLSDTIAAIATPKGKAALSIIRVSGSETFNIINKIARVRNIILNKMTRAKFYDGDTLLDDGMICLYKAPRSYTGEDMAELFCHGNDFILSQVLEALLKHCRLAEKGEFTHRAYLNRKIDLTQAEAIGNLLNAKSTNSQKAALLQLEGILSSRIKKILDNITDLRIILELAIDFTEDDVPEYNPEMFIEKINSILDELKVLINTAQNGIIVQEGIKICLIGAPNVGKSSIFNAFVQTERAITSSTPGTTRDYLEEGISLDGYYVKFIDTAGIHETRNNIEMIGIERSKNLAEKADLVFYITDPDIDEETDNMFFDILPKDKLIKVMNKIDLLENKDIKNDYIPCSTLLSDGLDKIKKVLINKFKDVHIESGLITNARQLACLKKAYNSLLKAKETFINNIGLDFLALDIQISGNALEELIGHISNEDILKDIFDNFCIGK